MNHYARSVGLDDVRLFRAVIAKHHGGRRVSPLIVIGAPGSGAKVTSSDATVKLPRCSGSEAIKITSLSGALPAL